MMQTGDEKTIQAQQRLEDFVKNYKIFIDTCSLLYEGADLFWKNIVPILEREQVKIIVPLRVIEEVQKIKTDQSKELATRERATNVEKTLEFLKSAKLIEIRGEPSDKFADNVFNTVFTKFRTDYNLLLITQDRDLGVDILKLNESKSVRGKKISVQRITHYGFLGKIEPKPGEGVSGNISKNNMSNKANAFNPKAGEDEKFKVVNAMTNVSNNPIQITKIPVEGDSVLTGIGGTIKIEKKLNSGGKEGIIYKTNTPYVAKIYKKGELTEQKQEKLKLMISKKITKEGICFPVEALYNGDKQFVGYLMPEASGKELATSLFLPKAYLEKEFPNWKKKELVELGLTILYKIKYLHERNIILGDINPANILVKSSREVFFVDTDSYQIEGYPCTVGMINFTAPEIHKSHKDYLFLRTLGNEYFAVSTLLFMIMLPGKPPYSHQGGGDQKANIISMDFSYPFGEITNKKTPDGPWRFMWSHLPRKLKGAFYNTFSKDGTNNNEKNRLSVDNWIFLFKEYFFLLDSGKFTEQDKMSEEIFPSRFKKSPKLTYIVCKKCGTEVDKEHSEDGFCRDCFRDEAYMECSKCGKRIKKEYSQNGLCRDCFKDAIYTTIVCSKCGTGFEITNGEYQFFQKKGFDLPKRCEACRQNKKVQEQSSGGSNYTQQASHTSRNNSSSLCFITTDYCEYFGKPDNCYELTQLRKFRDTWLSSQDDGKSLIDEYYKIAPQIVNYLKNDTQKDKVYAILRDTYIDSCIDYIERNEYLKCKRKYMDMISFLKKLYFGGFYHG